MHALPRVGYPPRDRHDFDPEVLGQVKRGHRDGAQEGSDIVSIRGLPTFMRGNINPKKSEGSLRQIYLFEARDSGTPGC